MRANAILIDDDERAIEHIEISFGMYRIDKRSLIGIGLRGGSTGLEMLMRRASDGDSAVHSVQSENRRAGDVPFPTDRQSR